MTAVAALVFLLASHPRAASQRSEAVAMVAGLIGTVEVIENREPRPVRLFESFRAGARIRVGPSSRLLLALANGARYELEESACARLTESTIELSGSFRKLASFPTLSKLAGVLSEEAAGRQAGAFRLRGGSIHGMYPRSPARSAAESTTLRFKALPGISSYKVRIEDDEGRTVLEADTKTASLRIGESVLEPSTHYTWIVRAHGTSGAVRGEADFETLPADVARLRRDLRLVATDAGASWSGFLAEIDRRLALFEEARVGFEAALQSTPYDAELKRSLESVRAELQGQ